MFDLDKIDEYFPFDEFREGQREAIEYALNAFSNGKRFVIIEAPTGAGKSPIGLTIAKFFNKAYYITIQKILQSQIINDFGGTNLVDLQGRATYPCTYYDRFGDKLVKRQAMSQEKLNKIKKSELNCNEGFCRKHQSQFKCEQCFTKQVKKDGTEWGLLKKLPNNMMYSACPYYEQVYKCIAARVSLFNFSSFLYQTVMTNGRFDIRDLLIIDESHNLEPELLSFIELKLNDRTLQNYGYELPKFEHPAEYWLNFEENKLHETIAEVITFAKNQGNLKLMDEYGSILRKIMKFREAMEKDEEWVAEYEDFGDYRTVTLKPIFVKDKTQSHIFKFGTKCLMMSATILDVDIFCRSLGINRNEVAAYRMKNRFPVENRPIYVHSYTRITGGQKKQREWGPKLIKAADEVIAKYPNDKGIIHTHNFSIAKLLVADSKHHKRMLFQKHFKNKNEMLEKHKNSKNSILVAPAMHEGLDLRGDLCYDSETDILTEYGWIQFPHLVQNIKVAEYDLETTNINFTYPTHIHRGQSNTWVEFSTNTNNLMVTAPHNMLWRNSQTTTYKSTKANDAPKSKHYQFVCAGCLNSNGLDINDDIIKFAVAFQADGSWQRSYDPIKFALRRSRKIERLNIILTSLNAQYTTTNNTSGDTIFIINKDDVSNILLLGKWYENKIWDLQQLLKLNIDQRNLLLDEIEYWDGSCRKNKYHKTISYSSSLRQNIDTIQAVATLTGRRSDYNQHQVAYKSTPFATFVNTEHNYIIKDYKLTMPAYCVTVPTGWIITRRRGKVTISGNSRFQIIAKVPFPNFYDDKQLARRVELDQQYYDWLVALKLVQSYGRSVRSETDHADTYVLDQVFWRFIKENRKMLPAWFLNAVDNSYLV